MLDRWSEHPVRPVPLRCPASVAMAVVTLLIAIAARLTPLSSLLASGSARAFDFQVWRPLVFSLTTSSVISAVLTGLLLVLIGYQIEPMIGSVQFAFLYLLCGVGGSAAISLAGVLYSFEGVDVRSVWVDGGIGCRQIRSKAGHSCRHRVINDVHHLGNCRRFQYMGC